MNKAQKMVGKGNLHSEPRMKLIEYGVPSHMHEGIVRYVEQGIVPGDFLQAVINNDLKRACMFADDHNKDRLHCFVMWFYNQAPSGCWGHENAVRDWCRPIPERLMNDEAEVT
jgi:hypothetical protein